VPRRRRNVRGPCHICGVVTDLSFEHVPPRAAFNEHPVWELRGDAVFRADLDNLPRGVQRQRGSGEYTLCEPCNKTTGGWYGRAFAGFAFQAAEILYATRGRASLHYPFHFAPLRVLKQIVCMFMSINSPAFAQVNPELVRFVKNKRAFSLPPKYRFFIYYNAGTRSRSAGVSGLLNTNSHQIRVLSEMTFPPFGYVLSLKGESPDDRLVDISWFARFLYDDWGHFTMRLPVLDVFTPFPGDYRDRQTVLREAARNREPSAE
jgi:hypothetical protein